MRMKDPMMSPVEKARQRREIEREVRAFIAKGGRIEILAVTAHAGSRSIREPQLLEGRVDVA